MIHKLVFDTTDANTIADSANVGAYLRAGTDGDLISSGDGDSDAVANTFEGIDTRAFAFGYDAVGDHWDRLNATAGAMHVFIDDGDFEIDVVINAEKAEDAAHVSGDTGNYVLTVREDTLATSTSTDGDYQSFKTNSLGELYTTDVGAEALLTTIDADTSAIAVSTASIDVDTTTIATNTTTIAGDTTSMDATLTGMSHAEDDAHVSGDAGMMSLAVRNDTLATLVDTDGDYAPLQVNASGALYTEVTGVVSTNDTALADTAVASAANPLTAANVAEDLVVAPLASRKYLFAYNNGNREAYIGATGVSAATGFPMPPGSILELRAGPSIDIEWVGPNTNQEMRTLELS